MNAEAKIAFGKTANQIHRNALTAKDFIELRQTNVLKGKIRDQKLKEVRENKKQPYCLSGSSSSSSKYSTTSVHE